LWRSFRCEPISLLVFLALISAFAVSAAAQEFQMPENPLRGRLVFEQKGCITCHSIQGEGGKVGPDLGQRKFYGSAPDLAAVMWTHAPEMLRRMRELDLPYPRFTAKEMSELIAYLYYLRYLGEPGDLYRGRTLVEKKGCLACHSIGGKGGDTAPAFDKLAKYVSPIYLAQAMWNHGPNMERSLKKLGMERPKFEPGEIVDLAAYIRQASRAAKRERVYMSPGNPQRGAELFRSKGCTTCHSSGDDRESVAMDLHEVDLNLSVTEVAGLMWNHGAEMYELMQQRKIDWPRFDGREMADLIAYLYFLKFSGEPGDPDAGVKVLKEKGCVNCHAISPGERSVGPNLAQVRDIISPIELGQVMWNHAPLMEELIVERRLRWPQLSGRDMADIFAFLRRSAGEERGEGRR
jgi:cytochrome c2